MDKFKASKEYENNLNVEKRKKYGIYYTPEEIVEYIVDKTVGNLDIIKNPCPKILDSSCGCGNFLICAYEKLLDMFEEKSYELVEKYKDVRFEKNNLPQYILKNCIYGTDVDSGAVDIAKELLLEKMVYYSNNADLSNTNSVDSSNNSNKENDVYLCKNNNFNKKNGLDKNSNLDKNINLNIYNEDGLKIKWDIKFDVIIGNPPYVGHKLLTKEYKRFVLEEYGDVYRDKSDLYFCFYKNSLDLLKDDGAIHLITPRYFLESMSAQLLRKYIEKNAEVEEIIDFLGDEVFTYIGVSACIIKIRKKGYGIKKTSIYRKISDKYVYKNERKQIDKNIESIKKDKNFFENIIIDTEKLQSTWIIANEDDMEIYYSIEKKDGFRLYEIAESFQGIITGCDKAFILKNNDKRIKNINPNLLKNWIKNKDINMYTISKPRHKLIYSNDIKNDSEEEYIFKNCISPYKTKLENRRECLKNIRKWYELQWGREKQLFERKKIMYPYKSRNNKFAVDYNDFYSSADVYSFYLKEEYENEFSYEYIVALLNSSIYNKYYKINAKKMSRGIYDYYPNKVMNMKIFKGDNYKKIDCYSKKIMEKKFNISDNIDKLIEFDSFGENEGIEEIEELNQNLSDEIDILIKKIDLLVEEDIFKKKI